MDESTKVIVAGLIGAVCGDSAKYIGEETKMFVEKCNVNLTSIFNKAKDKLGDRIDDEGSVNPRILKSIIDEGRFCEDELTAEYFGGILASSRTDNDRDDRGVMYMNIIKGLSVYQLRLHYLFYYLLKALEIGRASCRERV